MGEALLADHTGDVETASDRFRAALAEHRTTTQHLQHVADLIAYGGFLRRRARLVEARRALGRATDLAASIGAAGLEHDALVELRATGGRRRDRVGPRGLTPQEARVANLAALGRTNAEIAGHLRLTVKTVEAHLGHAFAKLGVRSRTMLVDALRDHPPTRPG